MGWPGDEATLICTYSSIHVCNFEDLQFCDLCILVIALEQMCKEQQGVFQSQDLRKVLPNDDRFEHSLHSVLSSVYHWHRGGMLI